jgi:CheY-like chemotaxis protein/HPt (histidine-containing phosphotransfer) domain-containing protein
MALSLQQGQPFPLVILDVNMPGMDGLEVAARIRRDPRLAGATIMMLSSASRPGDAAHCKEVAVAQCLTKPIKRSALLDAILAAMGARPRKGPETPLDKSRPRPLREFRVLLAEDNAVNQRLAVRMLEKAGHSVVVANDGVEALAALEDDTFDVVLMDMQMPEMDGFEAVAEIRKREKVNPRRERVPIIALTAHAMKGDREKCLSAGMDQYVSKPIHAETLFRAMEQVVPAGLTQEQAADAPGEPAPRQAPEPAPVAVTPPPNPSQGPGAPPFDIATAMQRLQGDEELFRELAALFLQNGPEMVRRISQAIDSGDFQTIHAATHALKGSVSNFEARPAFEAALNLEAAARDKDSARVKSCWAALQALMPALYDALAAYTYSPDVAQSGNR